MRLAEVYSQKKAAPQSQSKAERIQKYGRMRFEEYVEEWKAGQRCTWLSRRYDTSTRCWSIIFTQRSAVDG